MLKVLAKRRFNLIDAAMFILLGGFMQQERHLSSILVFIAGIGLSVIVEVQSEKT